MHLTSAELPAFLCCNSHPAHLLSIILNFQESEEASEVGLCKHLNFPYSDLAKGHVLTVRNRKLWNDSIGDNQADESQDLHTPLHGSIPRGSSMVQFVYLPL